MNVKGPKYLNFHSTRIDIKGNVINAVKKQRSRVHAVIVSEDAIVGLGWRLIQLSPTPAPSLLSTSASEPFSDASCSCSSCSEDGAESAVSLAALADAGTKKGATGGVGKGRDGKGRDAGAEA